MLLLDVAHAPTAAAAGATVAALAGGIATAQLLYPDGTVRWTHVVVGVEGYKNSLEDAQ